MLAASDQPHQPLYRQLAMHYQGAMERGTLAAGVRMPSVRELMRRHAVSLSTALQALRHLEEMGHLQARPRVGYFVSEPAIAALAAAAEPDLRMPLPLDENQFIGINERISMVLEKGRLAQVRVDLGSATPAAGLFDTALINRTAAALLREQPDLLVANRPLQATHPDFQAVMARRALDAGVQLAPQDILATSGNSQAVSLALAALAQPGDMVAVESPTYYGLLQAIEAQSLQALEIPSSPRTGISLEALELAIRTQPRLKAAVVIPHLQTPQGAVMPDANKEGLVALCREHNLAVIEDDSYGAFVESAQPLKPVKAWDTSGQVIYCVSMNKTLAPGLRQGWMNAGRWHARVQMLKSAQTQSTPAWGQLLAARCMATPAYDRHFQRIKAQLRSQRERMAQAIAKHFPAGTRLSLPPGGVSLWLELPEGVSSSVLFEQALQQGIRVSPGPLFSNTGRYERFLRLVCGMPFSPEVEWACGELGRLAQRLQAGSERAKS
ncbi:MAG TPA: PLP-dependent aminotransferase family protein [Burkholderiaceae bacterium]|nr:PLP-dependent aminotransferase family protein [Burkholderiaceae bacterium]